MSKAANGQQMLLPEALKLLDVDGQPIKWEKQQDGNYTGKKEKEGTTVKDAEGKDKKLPGATYIYSITLKPQIVDVGVIEEVEVIEEANDQQAAEVKKQAEIEKSVAESHESKTKQKKF